MKITTNKEHFEKYEKLFELKGKPNFDGLIPATVGEIKKAVKNGDYSLNTIPLVKWDGMAHYVGYTAVDEKGIKTKSLSQQVCMLKHYAKYHYAKLTPEFEN